MNTRAIGITFIVCFSYSSAINADPPTCENTWVGGYSSLWHDHDNWSEGHRPDDDEVACILSGATVHVWYAASGQSRAEAIYVDSASTVRVWGGDNFTLCASGCVASQIDGTLDIEKNGDVFIGASMVLNGSGTIKIGLTGSGSGDPNIDPVSGTPTLTLGSGLTLKGWGHLGVRVANNGVVAAQSGTLELQQGGEGSGKWTAETSTGRLLVSAEVTGAGTWELDDDAGAKIEIDAACGCLTGLVIITRGILDVDANFQTTNHLQMGGADSLIDVASTKSAKFNILNACIEE